jgi:hypothetical protein
VIGNIPRHSDENIGLCVARTARGEEEGGGGVQNPSDKEEQIPWLRSGEVTDDTSPITNSSRQFLYSH